MNLVVIDHDSKLSAKFQSEEALREKLGDPGCRLYQLNENELISADYDLGAVLDVSGCDRLLFISSFPNGFTASQRRLLVNKRSFQETIVDFVDADSEVYQDQLIRELNSRLAGEKLLYKVITDSSDDLTKAARELGRPVHAEKRLTVVCKHRDLGERAAGLFAKLLPTWQLIPTDQPDKDAYEDSNAVLLVGERPSDFSFQAPRSGMGKYVAWCCVDSLGYDGTSLAELRNSVYESLRDNGWNLNLQTDVYASSLDCEEIGIELQRGERTVESLFGAENFVMWDRYGLPITLKNQREADVRGFLDRICCFEKIAERM